MEKEQAITTIDTKQTRKLCNIFVFIFYTRSKSRTTKHINLGGNK